MRSPVVSPPNTPSWLLTLLGIEALAEGEKRVIGGRRFVLRDGILRAENVAHSASQSQTAEAFAFKWKQGESYASDVYLARSREWIRERYGEVETSPWWSDLPPGAVVLDAGCGAGVSGFEVLDGAFHRIRYLGVDISDAVDVAAHRFAERGVDGAFIQCSLLEMPLPPASVDVIFSEGVLHHTDSTRRAFETLTPLLKAGGRFMFYVYRRKGPIREFTDDMIRDRLQEMTPEEGWNALMPLTRLGMALGELEIEVNVPEDIELLGIPAGPIDLQRLFYWHVWKAYYRPDWSLLENHHTNYDWYAPRNAFRHTEEEVREWCEAAGLEVEHQHVHLAGITTIARRP